MCENMGDCREANKPVEMYGFLHTRTERLLWGAGARARERDNCLNHQGNCTYSTEKLILKQSGQKLKHMGIFETSNVNTMHRRRLGQLEGGNIL